MSPNSYKDSKQFKVCPSCNQNLPLIEFPKALSRPSGRASHCKNCRNKRYPYKTEQHRIVHLRHRYNLEIDEYEKIYTKQNGKCAICDCALVSFTKSTHIDHCHLTEKVRGLLCMACNTGLGKFKDNPSLLRKAASYVEKS